jgi:hypothetical protein
MKITLRILIVLVLLLVGVQVHAVTYDECLSSTRCTPIAPGVFLFGGQSATHAVSCPQGKTLVGYDTAVAPSYRAGLVTEDVQAEAQTVTATATNTGWFFQWLWHYVRAFCAW